MQKILVIEDTLEIRNYLVQLLRLSNYEVVEASNGLVGIQKMVENTPDLVLCDIMMPELNGYDVLTTVRNNPHLASTPFIFLSSKSDSIDFRRGMELGADDYLTKPIEPDCLLKAINTRLNRTKLIEDEIQQKVIQIKKNLSSVYSHEVNTPLNGIIGLSDILLKYYKNSMNSNIFEIVKHIKKASVRLYRTTSNLLKYADLQQYEANNTEKQYPRGRTEDYISFISEVVSDLAEKYNRRNDLILNLNDCDLDIAESDLSKIIVEVIDNAFKFSVEGSPVVFSSIIGKNNILFSISDKGRGISQENIDRIDSFIQFNRDSHEQQGMGLGLYIAKKIVKLNQGEFYIESNINQGTCITIKIPRTQN